MKHWSNLIFSKEHSFAEKAREVFAYQFSRNTLYQRYCEALDPEISAGIQNDLPVPDNIANIPLLPIRAFKDAAVTTQPEAEPDLIFKSSGTSAMRRSEHRVHDRRLYEQSLVQGFDHFYALDSAVIWGYLPRYADNSQSSLIYMIRTLTDRDQSGLSRFLPLDTPLDEDAIDRVKQSGKQLILFGAAFGLLDLLDMGQIDLPPNSIVIETGGMKTHRREIARDQLHQALSAGFGLDNSRIHSEYGMAELLSQAYARGGKWFKTVPWMQVSVRNPENPSEILPPYNEGLIGVIDLANIYSCSFILTSDKGMTDNNGRFQVLGRWNPRDLRGCNFLIEED